MLGASLNQDAPPRCSRIRCTLTPSDSCSRVRGAIMWASFRWLVLRARPPISRDAPWAARSNPVAISECRNVRAWNQTTSSQRKTGVRCVASSTLVREFHGRTTVAGAGTDEDLHPTSLPFTQAQGDPRLARRHPLDTPGLHAGTRGRIGIWEIGIGSLR